VAVALLAVAAVMAFYEWTRIKVGRPILKGHQAVVLYWIAYLTLGVLGVTLRHGITIHVIRRALVAARPTMATQVIVIASKIRAPVIASFGRP